MGNDSLTLRGTVAKRVKRYETTEIKKQISIRYLITRWNINCLVVLIVRSYFNLLRWVEEYQSVYRDIK